MVAIKYIQIETLGFILIRRKKKYGNNELMACIFNADKHNLMVLQYTRLLSQCLLWPEGISSSTTLWSLHSIGIVQVNIRPT